MLEVEQRETGGPAVLMLPQEPLCGQVQLMDEANSEHLGRAWQGGGVKNRHPAREEYRLFTSEWVFDR